MTALPNPISLPRAQRLLQREHLRVVPAVGDGWCVVAPNASYALSIENGCVLQLRGQWNGFAHDSELFHRLREVVATCNATRAFPKAYLWPLKDRGHYGLMAESSMLYDGDLTSAQFHEFLDLGLTSLRDFFLDAEAALPELVTWEEDDV
ncbi:YbjN domain-containing protein [Scrofimicrobium sp. R131]|uniref:YbjN domain-containing protein n=1 Tax=Scrofimicrobium appendicitidis TaxID=3079930 RepID=A0AAU7V7R9_9ACTO